MVIELDGGIHDIKTNKEYDEARTIMLAGLGIYVLRFNNDEVINDIEKVLKKIKESTNILE